ncbi:MAG: C39 family peptidase [Solirubrobacterales bacterium]|nr:C39 family peptidase [Solirubrobacterales bacterium]
MYDVEVPVLVGADEHDAPTECRDNRRIRASLPDQMLLRLVGSGPVDTSRARGRSRSGAGRRRITVAGALVGGVVVAVALAAGGTSTRRPAGASTETPPTITLMAGGRPIAEVDPARISVGGRVDAARARRELRRLLPAGDVTANSGRARLVYRYDIGATVLALARADGGRASAVRRPVSAVVAAPVVRQAQRNTCESAALEILLATVGREVGQARLQRALPRSGPLDPRGSGAGRTWGDPDRGYVGRPDGGGVAGGFGVYPAPVRATAARLGVQLDDLSGGSPGRVYGALRAGRAVMAWIGLSDGPFGEWRSPAGRRVRVNFGEHTVVLHGIRRDGSVLVSNPLEGTRERWSPAEFEELWGRLGRRALATRA